MHFDHIVSCRCKNTDKTQTVNAMSDDPSQEPHTPWKRWSEEALAHAMQWDGTVLIRRLCTYAC
jgi:hypothetical protein